jgi:hypothetical protein
MKTLTLLGCSSCILAALSGCGSDPITLGELIEAANDGDDGSPRGDDPPPVETNEPPTEIPPQQTQPAPETEASSPIEQEVLAILRVNCGNCHIGTEASGSFGVVDDVDQMIESGMIIPGDKEDSPLYARMVDQTMPPAFEQQQRPTQGQIQLVGIFIDDQEGRSRGDARAQARSTSAAPEPRPGRDRNLDSALPVAFLWFRTQQDGLPDREATGTNDRAVDSRVVLVRSNDRLQHLGRGTRRVRIQVHHRAACVAHRDVDGRCVLRLAEREHTAQPLVLLEGRRSK